MTVYPPLLHHGDTIGVTAPSQGVPPELTARLDFAIDHLEDQGFAVRRGHALLGDGVVSATPHQRAVDLMRMYTNPAVRAIVPPWGGETAIDLLDQLDFDLIAEHPTWLVGYSDISTLQVPITLLTEQATLHAPNLLETPYEMPATHRSWTEVVTMAHGDVFTQQSAGRYRTRSRDDWETDPSACTNPVDTEGSWTLIGRDSGPVEASGRLIGGCLETLSHLAGTPYGDVAGYGRAHRQDGLILYLESDGAPAPAVARALIGLRYAGWFDHAHAVLIGRTRGASLPGYTQHDAIRRALGHLDVPVLADVDLGHIHPQMAVINGAMATVSHGPSGSSITQRLGF